MVNDFSFTKVQSPEERLQASSCSTLAPPVSEHIASSLQSPMILENELFLDNMHKEADFSNFFLKNVSDLKK